MTKKMPLEFRSLEKFLKLDEAMAVFDIGVGKFVDCNEAALKLTRYTKSDLESANWRDLIPSESHAKIFHYLRSQADVIGFTDTFVQQILCKDGSSIDVRLRLHFLYDEDNKPAATLLLFRDISQQRNDLLLP